jgi:transcriptional regulator with XRE-family HTH domain
VIARRLQALWAIRPSSLREVADAISQETGRDVSYKYLSQLRNGTRADPSYAVIDAIARYFGVTSDYFSASEDQARETEEELRLLTAIRSAGIRDIAVGADGLSPRSLSAIVDIIRGFRTSEGLPPAPGPDGDPAQPG